MANNSEKVQGNLGYKILQGKGLTDADNKGAGNEAEGSFLSVPSKKVFTQDINNNPAQAVLDGVAQLVNAQLQPDPTSNGHAFVTTLVTGISAGLGVLTIGKKYYCTTSVESDSVVYNTGDSFVATSEDLTTGVVKERVLDLIDPKYGVGYTASPKEGANVISVDDPKLWIYQYDNGIFFQEIVTGADPDGIDVYQYIGTTLADGGVGGGHVIQEDGTPTPQRANLDFQGAAVEVTDDVLGDKTIVTINGGAGGIQGGIFIVDVQDNSGSGVVSTIVDNKTGKDIVTEVDTDTADIKVIVEYDGVSDDWEGSATVKVGVAGTPVAVTNLTRIGNTRRFSGEAVVNLTADEFIIAEHSGGASHQIIGDRAALPPEILTMEFTGGYPVGQTELKAGDTFQLTGTLDSVADKIEIIDFGAFNGVVVDIVDGLSFTITGTIANRGTSVQDLSAQAKAINTFGSAGSIQETGTGGSFPIGDGTGTIKLNNVYPTITFDSVTYPATQQALKGAETANVDVTTSDLDTISYTSGLSELSITNPTLNEATKVVTRIGGGYNISSNNLTATANRAANDATTIASTNVKIADADQVISVSEPTSRLRSGGNEGTSAQNHTITISSDQQLIEAPTLAAPVGTFQGGGFTGGASVWTRSLQIADGDLKALNSWGAMSSKNLAGKIVTIITGNDEYTTGGFVFRNVIVGVLSRTRAIGTNVSDVTKLRCSNLSKGASGSLNFTYKALTIGVAPVLGDDEVDRYTIIDGGTGFHDPDGDTWYNLDKLNSDSNTTGTMQIELEEII